jgi:hypothetical protein
MGLGFKIRPPYSDELPRVGRLLPRPATQDLVRIAVTGRVERIAAAAMLHLPKSDAGSAAYLQFTPCATSDIAQIMPALFAPLVAEATASGASDLLLVGPISEDHPGFQVLLESGFQRHRETALYRLDTMVLLRRVEPIFQRLLARRLIPPTARLSSPHGAWLPKLRAFLENQRPGLSNRIALATEGFVLEHSILLLVDDEIKGTLFSRNRGRESFIGLMLVELELRGGLPWANTFLTRTVLQDAVASGVEKVVFEVHEKEHRGTLRIAITSGAELIATRWQFRKKLCTNGSDTIIDTQLCTSLDQPWGVASSVLRQTRCSP